MLATDVSGSMQATDVAPDAARRRPRAAQALRGPACPKHGQRRRDGLQQHAAACSQSPTRDRAAHRHAIDRCTPRGGTATGEAIQPRRPHPQARAGAVNGKRPPAAIVLLSDGASTGGVDPVAAAQAARKLQHPRLHRRARHGAGHDHRPASGRPGGTRRARPARPAVARARSRSASGGKTFTAADTNRLCRRLQAPRLASSGRKNEKRQVTAGFAGGGLVLLLARRRPVPALVRPPDLNEESDPKEPMTDVRRRRPNPARARSRAPRSRRRCTRSSASSWARTRCSSACSSACWPAATCCSRACPASPRR